MSFKRNKKDSKAKDYNIELTSEQKKQVRKAINEINSRRIFRFAILTMIIELSLIVLYDIPNGFGDGKKEIIYVMYFVCHLGVFLLGLFALIFNYKLKPRIGDKIFEILPTVLVFLGMLIMATIGGLDQYRIGRITSYITMMLILSVALLIKPPISYIVFSIPQIYFLLLIYCLQNTQILDIAINSSLFYLCVLMITKVNFENQVDQIEKNMILVEINKQLEYSSNYDFLTNLYNRRYFEQRLREELAKKQKDGNVVFALAILDIDHFKRINDQYGHKVGDLVLQEVAKIMLYNLQKGNLTARWGGEEFIILFSDDSLEQCIKDADVIRKAIESHSFYSDDDVIQITASLGLAKLKGESEKELSSCFSKADEALYLAKQSGRNRIEYDKG